MSALSKLQPKAVFSYFERLCSVPHGSGNTKQISDLCIAMAEELGLDWRQDVSNNVVIWKKASPGCENSKPIILQGHLDMVCAKEDGCTKDMTREGLDLRTDGEWVWADKTSLGGDNCIAVAMIFAILADKTLVHPPLEAVFTVDEEVGMDGAAALDCSDIKGRKLLNLDSEEEGVFTVSCAGGARANCFIPAAREGLCDEVCYQVTLDGLLGGHSGGEINKGRGNANVLMARVLYAASLEMDGLRLCSICGGQFDNVICPKAEAVVAVPAESAEKFCSLIAQYCCVLQNEYAASDARLRLTCCRAAEQPALSCGKTEAVLTTLFSLPQGVQEMSFDFAGLVQTSLNMGTLAMKEDGVHFSYSVRSCIASQKKDLLRRVSAIVTSGGGTVEVSGDYPGWQFRKESAFRDVILQSYKNVTGEDGRIEATHGGLECGLFIEKIPGLDAVSMGPELHDVHSAKERLSVASTQRTYEVVCEVLKNSCTQ